MQGHKGKLAQGAYDQWAEGREGAVDHDRYSLACSLLQTEIASHFGNLRLAVYFPCSCAQILMATKRNFEGAGEDSTKKSKMDETGLMENRFLIDGPEVGIIIGKGGANVKQIREASGAFVSILKSVGPQATERILVVKGPSDKCATAIHGIAGLLVDSASARALKAGVEGTTSLRHT
jgi:hypothetical protein